MLARAFFRQAACVDFAKGEDGGSSGGLESGGIR